MTKTQTKAEFLTDALIELVNDRIKVDSLESGRSCYYLLETNLDFHLKTKTQMKISKKIHLNHLKEVT